MPDRNTDADGARGGRLKAAALLGADLDGLDGSPADLIPVLQRVQAARGYLSPESLRIISRWLKISENQIYGVTTFFTQFRFTPPGEHVIRVCLGTACHVRGGEQILDVFRRRLEVEPGETTPDRKYQLERVACLGCCALAPVLVMDDRVYGQSSVLKVQELLGQKMPDERTSGEKPPGGKASGAKTPAPEKTAGAE